MALITPAQAQDLLDRTPLARRWGVTALEVGEGWTAVGLGARPEFPGPGRVPHAACYELIAVPGRRIVFGEAPTTAEDGSLVAHSTLSCGRPAAE